MPTAAARAKQRRDRRRAVKRAAALACLLSMAAGVASATVIEISPSGEAVTYSAPAIFTADGARPIEPPLATLAARSESIPTLIRDAAQRHNLSADLLHEVARRESGLRQTAVSSRGAVGIMQLMAPTAAALGIDRFDTAQNIGGGAAYLRSMLDRYGGDQRLALAAYNAGPGAVDRYRGVPPYPETQAYVAAILARLPQRPIAIGLGPNLIN